MREIAELMFISFALIGWAFVMLCAFREKLPNLLKSSEIEEENVDQPPLEFDSRSKKIS